MCVVNENLRNFTFQANKRVAAENFNTNSDLFKYSSEESDKQNNRNDNSPILDGDNISQLDYSLIILRSIIVLVFFSMFITGLIIKTEIPMDFYGNFTMCDHGEHCTITHEYNNLSSYNNTV